jgi:hypothetical protein
MFANHLRWQSTDPLVERYIGEIAALEHLQEDEIVVSQILDVIPATAGTEPTSFALKFMVRALPEETKTVIRPVPWM